MTDSAFHRARAEKLIRMSQNPTKSLKYANTKHLLAVSSEQEKLETTEALTLLENGLKEERVERSCGRAKAIWLTDEELALVEKPIGNCFKSIGQQKTRGILLYPEEALFLIETNRLTLYWNEVPFSIEQAYNVLLNANMCSFPIYKMYRKLVMNGYKINRKAAVNYEPILKKMKLFKHGERCSDSHRNFESLPKRKNHDGSETSCSNTRESLSDNFNLLLDLRLKGPSVNDYSPFVHTVFEVYSPETSSKKNSEPEYLIDLLREDVIPPQIGVIDTLSSSTHLFTVVPNDGVMFYQIDRVDIGDLD